jgi:hypothetical protein
MRHASFTLATLEIDDEPLRLLTASLMVVRRPDVVALDWEVVATTLPGTPLEHRPVHLVMTELLDGRLFRGDAFVVRSDEQRHVFRGGGQLSGLMATDDLEEQP